MGGPDAAEDPNRSDLLAQHCRRGGLERKQLTFGIIDPALQSVATGGTIAERTRPTTGGVEPALSGTDLVKAVPRLAKLANVGVLNFSDVEPSQIPRCAGHG